MSVSHVASAYDARADEYVDLFGSVDKLAEADRRTIERWRDETPGRLLDAGCGPGHWSDVLSVLGTRTVVGIDGSSRFLESARRRFPRIGFARADLAVLPIANESVGGILAWYSIIHADPSEVPAILGEFARVLRPEGSLLLGFFDGDAGQPFDHKVTTAYYWSADALVELLALEGFAVRRAGARQEPGVRRHGELVASLIS
ncbi:class I SAM-dependent methyltransferase [Nocardioides sp. CER19]|uniref:class I SAM-dependent methyltransferase n=1 Tax=Nocardioides sp. CER19 TaxID=3038538 RepID=UPI00244BA8A8|nr:class I SAM-dependent methyltransferase [Nocardioides sp. CER19]MDH2414329.1 class I SAM-dependent methyltransferase [Nocardioides sp. CER19]